MTFSDWYWIVWFVGGFGVYEITALATGHPERTLSEAIWRWFNVLPGQSFWQIGLLHLLLVIGLTWAWGHLAWGWWHVWRV